MNVLVLLPLSSEQRSRLEAGAPTATYVYSTHAEVTDEQIAAADVIVGNLKPARLAGATKLQLLQLNSAGYDNYIAAPVGTEVAIASASGAYGRSVSEHLFAMVLAMIKRLPAYRDAQRAHDWCDLGPVTSLVDAKVLVLGAGDIGSHFAKLAASMGAHVTGFRRHAAGPQEGFEAIRTMDELPEALPEADVVVSFLPSTPETRGLVDAEFLARMREGSYLANGGRGDLVVEADLVAALESGHIAGAALDVTSPEPLPTENPLWDAPNAFITPHVAGQFHLAVTLNNIVDIAAENLRHLEAGEPIRNRVDR